MIGESMEDKKQVFLALLEEWTDLNETVIGEYSGHISEDLKALPDEAQKWIERYERAR